jgi:2OG-Fe(II) oxygenase superfamily
MKCYAEGVPLRAELLRFTRDDGGLDLLDLALERVVSLSADEARRLDDADVIAKLDSLMLLEGPVAETIRETAWSARAKGRPAPFAAAEVSGDWSEPLPEIVAPAWRTAERLRRLAEERAAGRRFLFLPGFVAAEAASRLAAQAAALEYRRMDTDIVHAERHLLGDGELAEWRALMLATRRLFGSVLGLPPLPEKLFINAWRMRRGDTMSVHPDGRLYCGTLSLGLCDGWTAADGGAIAFGDPTPNGFQVRERWLPHLGDALLFAPAADTWHAVEPVLSDKTRHSLTGWWAVP